ncbi:MAG: site-2 protease family protein [Candidatus Acidiferrales bacterium]
METQSLALGLIWYIVFLFSTTCHEAAHAMVAKLGGDLTAFHGGQVSLNPVPHIRREPIGLVIVPILSFILAHWMIGWASAPYDPSWRERYPRRAAWMALAGPGANFALMLIAAIGIRTGMALGVFHPPQAASFTQITQVNAGGPEFAATFLSILFVENLLLGTFNLIPVPPLDGNSGITLLMSERVALRFAEFSRGQLAFAGIILAWYLYGKIFMILFQVALNALYPGAHYGSG